MYLLYYRCASQALPQAPEAGTSELGTHQHLSRCPGISDGWVSAMVLGSRGAHPGGMDDGSKSQRGQGTSRFHSQSDLLTEVCAN